jgi:hypothetical protein
MVLEGCKERLKQHADNNEKRATNVYGSKLPSNCTGMEVREVEFTFLHLALVAVRCRGAFQQVGPRSNTVHSAKIDTSLHQKTPLR